MSDAKDDLKNLDEAALEHLGIDLEVPRLAGEDLETFRARVAQAFNDDARIDAAGASEKLGGGFVLGGFNLGDGD